MSRTPLFSLVRRSLRLAQVAVREGRTAAEVVDEHRDAITRRRFLGTAAAAGAVVALDGCARIPAARGATREPVLVVGAGIAGLTAAWRLRQAGIPVRIVEAQDRTGGRMFSLRNFFGDGQVAELGGELVDTGHVRIQALARELGITLDDLSHEPAGIRSETYFIGGARRTETEIVEAVMPLAQAMERDLAAVSEGDIGYRTPLGAESLDRMTLTEWLDRAGVSGWFRTLIDVAYTSEFGLEPERQSALNLLTMIETHPFRIFGESDERFRVHEGNDAIPRALASRLGDAIETGMRLEAIRPRAGGGFVASMRRGATSVDVGAEQMVVAIPFTLLRDVRIDVDLPPVKRRAITELGYGTNAKLMTGYSRRVWRESHASNGSVLSDTGFQVSWETSRGQSGSSGILTNFSGGRRGEAVGSGTAGEQATRFVGELERVFPGVSAARAGMREARFHWPSFPFTRGSYACYLPGQWTGIAGAEGESVGGLHFAGEHCSRVAQGFMEGGCETGEAAARAVLAAFGARRDAALPGGRRAALRSLGAATWQSLVPA